MPGIIEDLLQKSSSYNFIQAIRLLIYSVHMRGDEYEGVMRRKIRVHPHLSLDFPGTDIISIEQKDTDPDKYFITSTFLGLYGASSPLPTFYTEDLLEEASDDRSISRDFIDIINTPAYMLFFKCWGKYSFFYNLVESRSDDVLDRLFCLLGFGTEKIRENFVHPTRFLRYIGLTTQMPRSAEGLRALISDSISEPSIDIEQCVPAMVEIPADQLCILGARGHCLGEDASIGSFVSDSTGKFRVHAGPLSGQKFQDLLPGGEPFMLIGKFIDYYLDQPLDWDMEIKVDEAGIRPVNLGDAGCCRLGWNTWLGSDTRYPENRVRLEAGH
ncbi:MAG: type secretion protein, family [Deltaproteobacteria bacterium]|nr:type secretion protein, family [Deltaproteobacteria bacterium]